MGHLTLATLTTSALVVPETLQLALPSPMEVLVLVLPTTAASNEIDPIRVPRTRLHFRKLCDTLP